MPIFNADHVAHKTKKVGGAVVIPLLNDVKDQLQRFTVLCVFDGHNGSTVSQHLCDHFVDSLVAQYAKLLSNKGVQDLLISCCEQMDNMMCKMLRSIDDCAGSTGVVAVYDGRKHVLYVANVGDSSCIICKNDGKATRVLRMHRLSDNEEKARVNQTNAKIMNNRYVS